MSDTHDLQGATATVENLTVRTGQLTAAASSFAKTMTQAFASSVAGGQKLDDTLKTVALKLMEMAGHKTGGFLAGGIKGLIDGLAGKGGSSGGSSLRAFASGGIIGTPSYFPMSGGGTGLAGEAGPEAIMPLARASDGSLGVAAQGGGNTIHVQIATPDVESFRRSEGYVTGQIARAVARGQRSL